MNNLSVVYVDKNGNYKQNLVIVVMYNDIRVHHERSRTCNRQKHLSLKHRPLFGGYTVMFFSLLYCTYLTLNILSEFFLMFIMTYSTHFQEYPNKYLRKHLIA